MHEVRVPRDVRDGTQPYSSVRMRRVARLVPPPANWGTNSSPQRIDRDPAVVPRRRTLVTRGHGRRGPCRAQFRSAPSSEHTPRPLSSSSIARVRAARGLFEHGEAHRRARQRGCAFSPPPHGATCPSSMTCDSLPGQTRITAGDSGDSGTSAIGGSMWGRCPPSGRILDEKRR